MKQANNANALLCWRNFGPLAGYTKRVLACILRNIEHYEAMQFNDSAIQSSECSSGVQW